MEKPKTILPSYRTPNHSKNLSMEEIFLNLSMLKNSQQPLNDTTNTNYNLNITTQYLNETISMNNRSLIFNSSLNKTISQKPIPKQNSLTKVATSIIIDENLTDLNEKLKKANDFYVTKSNFKDKINIEIDSVLNFDRSSRSPVNNRTRITTQFETENKNMHVSRYIKKFLNQTHEDIDENADDVFKMKNCKINSKELNETIFASPLRTSPNRGKEQRKKIEKKKSFDIEHFGMTCDNTKIKSYCDKLSTRRNFMKTESEKMANLRNTFMSTFNENKFKEEKLYHELVEKFDSIKLESYCNTYREILKNAPKEKISPTLVDIKNILSFRKDQMINLLLNKKQIKSFLQAQSYYDDILLNDWTVSHKTIQALVKIINQ